MVTSIQGRAQLGPYTLVAACITKGHYHDDRWAIPGRRILSTNQLHQLAVKRGWDLQVLR